ncbi:hypothetical protein CHARACLAT_006403 [Characodon lateralis]|uniref:Uncharacterized protein n=1 Tax=Characodon lateralis TaxID=208331 RepID=A0ABU7F331_9TELE|nr:hypothetical protein [Characodon lateralis]
MVATGQRGKPRHLSPQQHSLSHFRGSQEVAETSSAVWNEKRFLETGLSDVTLEDMIGGGEVYISVRLHSHLLASGISAQLLYLQGRRTHKISKSWQADGNLHFYRTDYLVTDHLAVAHSDSVFDVGS